MLELKSATKADGAGSAVGPLDLSIGEGQFVALLGGSGSGKTTTLKMINGLAPATAGQVTVGGQPLSAEPGWKLRRRIGYVFQEIGLFPHMTVAENIGVGPKLAAWDAARIAARTDELLDLVSLPREVAARLPTALSG